VREASRGPLCLAPAEDLVPPLAKDVWTSAVIFEIAGLATLESRHDFDLSAVQISGLPGNDRPLTHTVTLRVARSFAVARWRHSLLTKIDPADTIIRVGCSLPDQEQIPTTRGSPAPRRRGRCSTPNIGRDLDGCQVRTRSADVRYGSLADFGEGYQGCPLYPQRRTCSSSASMSAMCQKRTWVNFMKVFSTLGREAVRQRK
jgi:hypothetical protein